MKKMISLFVLVFGTIFFSLGVPREAQTFFACVVFVANYDIDPRPNKQPPPQKNSWTTSVLVCPIRLAWPYSLRLFRVEETFQTETLLWRNLFHTSVYIFSARIELNTKFFFFFFCRSFIYQATAFERGIHRVAACKIKVWIPARMLRALRHTTVNAHAR